MNVGNELRKYVKLEVDLSGLVNDVVVEKVLEPQLVKLIEKIKKVIPGGIDDAILDNLLAKELPNLKKELAEEMEKLEVKLQEVIHG